MELLALALTVFLFGAFLYVTGGGWMSAGKAGGPLRLRIARPYRRIGASVVAALLTGGWLQLQAAVVGYKATPTEIAWMGVLMLVGPYIAMATVQQLSHPIEIREKGIVVPANDGSRFWPWNQVHGCQWSVPPGTLLIQCVGRQFKLHVPPAQADYVTAALTGCVEIRDADDNVIVPAPTRAAEEEATAPALRLQYRLSALLLLAAALAAGSGWFATVVHRLDARYGPLAGVQSFDPVPTYEGDNLVVLGFARPARLGDDDLATLAGCTKLRHLMLGGSQVTDAGLVHLEGLTGLRFLDLTGTQVTPAGVDRLQKALPKAAIGH